MNIVLHYPTYSQFNKKPKLYHSGGDPTQQWDPVLGWGSQWVGLSPWVGPCPGVGAQFPTVAVCAVLLKYNHKYSNDNNKDTNTTANIANIVI